MKNTAWLCLWMLCLSGTWLIAAPGDQGTSAAQFGVEDRAGFFARGAVARADEVIWSINRRYNKDLLIETFDDIPKGTEDRLDALGKDAFYTEWATAEARKAHVTGIIILIVKQTSRVQIQVGNKTSLKAFTPTDRKELMSRLLSRLRDKDYDRALVEAADFVLEQLEKNLGPGAVETARPQTEPALPAPAADPVANAPATRPTTAPSAPPASGAASRPDL